MEIAVKQSMLRDGRQEIDHRAGVKDDLIASEALAKDYKLKLCSSCLSDQRA